MIAPAPTQIPSTAATTGCGQPRIALTRSPVIRVKRRSSGIVHLRQRPDDLVHVAAGGEVAARAGEYDGFDVVGVDEVAEEVAELGVALERQRVLLLRPVERDGGDAVLEVPEDMLRGERAGIHAGGNDGIGKGPKHIAPRTSPPEIVRARR